MFLPAWLSGEKHITTAMHQRVIQLLLSECRNQKYSRANLGSVKQICNCSFFGQR